MYMQCMLVCMLSWSWSKPPHWVRKCCPVSAIVDYSIVYSSVNIIHVHAYRYYMFSSPSTCIFIVVRKQLQLQVIQLQTGTCMWFLTTVISLPIPCMPSNTTVHDDSIVCMSAHLLCGKVSSDDE